MGGFLTLLAVVALRKEGALAQQKVSREEKVVAATESMKSAETPQAAAGEHPAGAQLWEYTDKPAMPARLESLMATPSKDVHYAKLDRALLGGADSPLKKPGSRVDIALPNGETMPVVIDKTREVGPNRYVTEGTIDGGKHGRAVFAYNNGEVSAVFDDMEYGSWQVRSMGDSVAQVFQTDSALVPPCAARPETHRADKRSEPGNAQDLIAAAPLQTATQTRQAAGDVTLSADYNSWAWGNYLGNGWGNTEVRIMVPYSAVLRQVLSEDTINNWIDLAVASLNNDLARSGVPVTMVLAGAPAVQYNQEWQGDPSTAIDDALTRSANSIDGVMDEIHVMRGETQADLVCFLLCELDSNNSGVGYILATPGDSFNATWAFSVVNFWYMNSGSVFSHEVGHNMGCNHDRDNARSTSGVQMQGAYSYSYGYRFYGSNGQQYRTIMAYSPGQVIPYYSNPNIMVPDPVNAPVGSQPGSWDEAYNALTIQQNAGEVANYHNTRVVLRTLRRLRGW